MTSRRARQRAIWLFAGGPLQEIAARKVLEWGYKLLLTDRNPQCACAPLADKFLALDTFDIEGNLEAAALLSSEYRIQAVLAPAADCHETVARVARSLGISGIDPEIAHVCRQKALTRQALSAAGILQPGFEPVRSVAEARQFLRALGKRAVLKATDNSASRGFAAIQNPADLTSEIFERALAAGSTGSVIVEEMLVPVADEIAEQSVETLWYDGKMYWLNWVDRLFRKDFLFFPTLCRGVYDTVSCGVELGHINPGLHTYSIKEQVHDLLWRAGKAIGMDKQKGGHILKADIMLTEDGPCILELTPRLSGGWDSSASTPRRGADFVGGAMSLALGKELDLDLWHAFFQYRDPELFVAVLAQIEAGATDCTRRDLAIGSAYDREQAIATALANLRERRYVASVV